MFLEDTGPVASIVFKNGRQQVDEERVPDGFCRSLSYSNDGYESERNNGLRVCQVDATPHCSSECFKYLISVSDTFASTTVSRFIFRIHFLYLHILMLHA